MRNRFCRKNAGKVLRLGCRIQRGYEWLESYRTMMKQRLRNNDYETTMMQRDAICGNRARSSVVMKDWKVTERWWNNDYETTMMQRWWWNNDDAICSNRARVPDPAWLWKTGKLPNDDETTIMKQRWCNVMQYAVIVRPRFGHRGRIGRAR